MADAIISRREAYTQGLKYYFSGEPCKRGHVVERLTRNGLCSVCFKLAQQSKKARSPQSKKAQSPQSKKARSLQSEENTLSKRERNRLRSATWYAANKDRHKANRDAYNAKNAERLKAWLATYTAENKDKQKARSAAWYASNKEKMSANVAAWRVENPEKFRRSVRATSARRRARKLKAGGKYTTADVQRIYKAQGGKCACCREKVGTDYHVDHIQPLAKGGSNSPSNIQILCPPCNKSKNAKDPIEFMQSRGFLL